MKELNDYLLEYLIACAKKGKVVSAGHVKIIAALSTKEMNAYELSKFIHTDYHNTWFQLDVLKKRSIISIREKQGKKIIKLKQDIRPNKGTLKKLGLLP